MRHVYRHPRDSCRQPVGAHYGEVAINDKLERQVSRLRTMVDTVDVLFYLEDALMEIALHCFQLSVLWFILHLL